MVARPELPGERSRRGRGLAPARAADAAVEARRAGDAPGADSLGAAAAEAADADTSVAEAAAEEATGPEASGPEGVGLEVAGRQAETGPPGAGAAAIPESPGGLPRWLVLLVGGAAATIALGGIRTLAWLIAPVLLALVIVVALMPVQRWLLRHGWPRWASASVLLLLVWAVLLSFVALLVVSVAQLAALLPDYAPEFNRLLESVQEDLNDAGVVSGQLSDLLSEIDYGQLVGVATGLLSSLTEAASTLLLLLSALVFLAIESGGFGRRLALIAGERPHLLIAMGLFARGTRSYLLVSTVFGFVVAVGDTIALAIIGVPLPLLWGLLSFITNYVPNIGFVLGLLPPALLALLDGGWSDMWAVVIVYAVLNFVIQTLIQPRFVGDSVGLSMTVTFVALLFWGWALGALGALLAIPLTLLVKALLVDVDPRGHWLDALLREEPRAPRTSRARQRAQARRAALASVRALHVPRPHVPRPGRRGQAGEARSENPED
ncbi:AI-2E family transporter [Trujillonella endophytica]|uniref:Predicted PurR-regulated permease PerM n=1 Tax=Trujillonella endophytica TaxID=673521 RepID=A0A1H8PQJ7_9ACTN|nr:AI-2E family transporter [Trujillella endophytica]SEO43968.1 Predicted PurR-regulated permease PerM [Trujillella endophytica]